MEKKKEQPTGPEFVVSDGVTTPSKIKDLEERYGLIPPGMSIAEWEALQLADWLQNTSYR